MYVGTVLQHLVAAKLTIVAPEVEINDASVADDPSPRLPTVRPRTSHKTVRGSALLFRRN